MLEQYQKDFSSNADDALSESRFQMSRRKLVFTLAGASLALLSFLFLVGTFKTEETAPAKPALHNAPSVIDLKLQEIEARLAKLEKQPIAMALAPEKPAAAAIAEPAFDPEMFEEPIVPAVQTLPVIKEPASTAHVKTEQLPASRSYVVQKGDSLSKISSRFYGTTKYWKEIYNANKERIGNMNQLKVGTELTIPEESVIGSKTHQAN